MSWLSAFPDVLVCVGLFLIPGLLVTYLGGLRGITAWATAPLVTVAVAAMIAVLGGMLNFGFGLWSVAAGTGVAAGLSAALSWLLRRHKVERPPRDPGRYSLAVALGAALAAVIGGVTFITGIKRPDAISQTWDAVYHYNAIRYIEETGKASPLTVGTLGQPGGHGVFYPDAWHAMAALLARLTGAQPSVAVTVTCLVVVILIWPLSCLLLARHLFGNSGGSAMAAVVITGLLSNLFGAFPWLMTGWGVLWPNALGMAMAPAGIALCMSIIRISDGDTFGGQRWFFGPVGAWAIAIAHPNSALSVAVICLVPVLVVAGRYAARQYARDRFAATALMLAIGIAVSIAFIFVHRLPLAQTVAAQFWLLFETPGRSIVNAFSDATDGQSAEWPLAAFLLIGVIACFVWRRRRWLVGAEVLIIALYVGSAASGSNFARFFTGFWYDDSHRLAAALPIVAIPLSTFGVLAAGEWLGRLVFRADVSVRPNLAFAVPLAVGTVLALGSAAQSLSGNALTLGGQSSTSGNQALVSPQKIQFLRVIARFVPSDALVADNPVDGTAYLWALTGTHVLFPQMGPQFSNADMTYLAGSLVELGKNRQACDLVRRYGVGYLVIAPNQYTKDWPISYYAGIADPVKQSGFRLVAADGPMKLYKITICQPANQSPGSIGTAGGSGQSGQAH